MHALCPGTPRQPRNCPLFLRFGCFCFCFVPFGSLFSTNSYSICVAPFFKNKYMFVIACVWQCARMILIALLAHLLWSLLITVARAVARAITITNPIVGAALSVRERFGPWDEGRSYCYYFWNFIGLSAFQQSLLFYCTVSILYAH